MVQTSAQHPAHFVPLGENPRAVANTARVLRGPNDR